MSPLGPVEIADLMAMPDRWLRDEDPGYEGTQQPWETIASLIIPVKHHGVVSHFCT